jgi:hypothetical protein
MREFSVTRYYVALTEEELPTLPIEGIGNPEYAVFENRERLEIDEIGEFKEGRLYLSSFNRGIVEWSDGQYVHHYHGYTTKLGQLKEIVFSCETPRMLPSC